MVLVGSDREAMAEVQRRDAGGIGRFSLAQPYQIASGGYPESVFGGAGYRLRAYSGNRHDSHDRHGGYQNRLLSVPHRLLPVYQPLATKRRTSTGRRPRNVVDGGRQVVKCLMISGACGIGAGFQGERVGEYSRSYCSVWQRISPAENWPISMIIMVVSVEDFRAGDFNNSEDY